MIDILYENNNFIFSYRVAGILLHNNKILLQRPINDSHFAVPGGHVMFGEINAETLVREFKEEIGIDIIVGELKWVAENFFSWGDKQCHQICLYYEIALENKLQIPLDGMFIGTEDVEEKKFNIEFHWISLEELDKFKIYPINIVELMKKYNGRIQHFVYKEELDLKLSE